MTVSSVSSNAASFTRSLSNQDSRVKSALSALASGSRFTSPSVDVSSQAISTALQSASATLATTSQNLAQSSALVDTANGGASQIADGLSRLAQLATEASSTTLSADDRAALNTEFQSVRQGIDSIATGTTFNAQPLLDGSLAASVATASGSGTPALNIGSLTDNSLFNGANVDLLSASNAQAALAAVSAAQTTVSSVQTEIASTSEILQFSAANVNSALENQQAAASTLSDADFGAASSESASALVQSQFTIAASVQTNRLQRNVLDLLKE